MRDVSLSDICRNAACYVTPMSDLSRRPLHKQGAALIHRNRYCFDMRHVLAIIFGMIFGATQDSEDKKRWLAL